MQKFRRLGLGVRVHDNRVEILKGIWPFRNRSTILYSNISNIELSTYTRRLIIKTNDGKEQKLALGGLGKAQKCHDAIVAKM